jgi:hypothetical protein
VRIIITICRTVMHAVQTRLIRRDKLDQYRLTHAGEIRDNLIDRSESDVGCP